MAYDYTRSQSFEVFACLNDGNSLRRRIHAMARHYVSSHAAKIDANWHSVEIRFDSLYVANRERLELPIADKNACRVEFDYRPSSVTLIGPKVGHVSLTEEIFRMIPEPLVALMRMCDVLRPWNHTLCNPKHVIELIEGKTLVHFENCVGGVVRNVRGDSFDVEGLVHDDLGEDQRHYTRERLLEEFKDDGLNCQAVDVDYLPFLPQDGMPLNTVEDVREHARVQREKYEAERPQREAEAAARAAAKEAALPPEVRARRDAFRARLAAQAGLVRKVLPHL